MALQGGTRELAYHDRSNAADPSDKRPRDPMVTRPVNVNAYEFVVVAALRAKQLLAGCTPRLAGDHNAATMAQMEVAAGYIPRVDPTTPESPATASAKLL